MPTNRTDDMLVRTHEALTYERISEREAIRILAAIARRLNTQIRGVNPEYETDDDFMDDIYRRVRTRLDKALAVKTRPLTDEEMMW